MNSISKGKFISVCDGSWGSSGKGAISARIADLLNIQNFSSANFPNAGHTFVNEEGDATVFKALPTPSILRVEKPDRFSNAHVWLSPNSGFEEEQLAREIAYVGLDSPQSPFLHIHPRAVIVNDNHKAAEGEGGSLSTLHISSTMSGAGASYAMKAMRQLNTFSASEIKELGIPDDPHGFYQSFQKTLETQDVLHEVSQGYALSLDHGNHLRHGTFRNCTPQQAWADFCLKPAQMGDVFLNLRTFPIRVGNNYDGNGAMLGFSGNHYPDQFETDWKHVAHFADFPPDVAESLFSLEKTTVTKKLRRVFTHSPTLVKEAAKQTAATALCLNFVHYLHYSALGAKGGFSEFKKLHPNVVSFVHKLEDDIGLPVLMLGTGARHDQFILPHDTILTK